MGRPPESARPAYVQPGTKINPGRLHRNLESVFFPQKPLGGIMVTTPDTAPAGTAAQTLSKAVTRAAQLLGIAQTLLASILGVSPATASRLVAGSYHLQSNRKEWEFALLFVRIFRSLDAILGHGEQARRWLNGPNLALGARPIDLLGSTEGLVRVLHYLDAHRGRL
jgi:uncharacterized protein (DUF2384 family)